MSPDNFTQLLHLWQSDHTGAEKALYDLAYQHLHHLAQKERQRCANKHGGDNPVSANPIHNTTALVHDAYLKLSQHRAPECQNRNQFFLMVSKVMRQILVDHARKALAQKRQQQGAWPEETKPLDDLLSLDKAIERLDDHYPRQASAVKLKYFAGLRTKEISELLNCSESLIEKDLRFSRSWIQMQVG